jgi:hypothetical protein
MQPVQFHIVSGRGVSRFYVAAFVVAQTLLLASTFYIASTPWFLWHDHYAGLRNIGYSHRAGHLDCQVLIYGDSSSLTGLDPAIIQRITGLKTCNVSEGITEQAVVGSDEPLKAYLKDNTPPRFLIGTWTPSSFRPDFGPYDSYFPEGFVYALQLGDRRKFFERMVRKPTWLGKFSIWTLQSLADGLLDEFTGKSRHQIDARAQRDARSGQWLYPSPPETQCVRGNLSIAPEQVGRWQNSVENFRNKYNSSQTTVIIDISPVPDCDASYRVYANRSAGLHDNAFERLPIRFFNEGDVHFSPEGSDYISQEAGRQILAHMKDQPPQLTSTEIPR